MFDRKVEFHAVSLEYRIILWDRFLSGMFPRKTWQLNEIYPLTRGLSLESANLHNKTMKPSSLQRRQFVKSLSAFFSWCLLKPRKALAQVIPFSFWQKVTHTSAWTWGVNATFGQLGVGTHVSYSSPVQLTGSWAQLDSAWSGSPVVTFSMGIRTNGTLWAWGDNAYGELGQNTHTGKFSSPVQIAGSWIQMSCGGKGWTNPFGMAIRSDRTLWSWGSAPTTSASSPVQVAGGTSGSWAMVAAGYEQWFGIQVDGTLWACGGEGAGELGIGQTTGGAGSPTQIAGSWVQVNSQCDSSAGGFSGGIKTDGSLWMWGGNGAGDLGTGDTNTYSVPVQIGTYSWIQLSLACSSYALAIRADGTLWGWGDNSNGQLGVGDTTARSSPVQVPGQWRDVFALSTAPGGNGGATLAIRNDGTLWGWGDNTSGCIGIGSTTSYSSPVLVSGGTWSTLSGAAFTAFALK